MSMTARSSFWEMSVSWSETLREVLEHQRELAVHRVLELGHLLGDVVQLRHHQVLRGWPEHAGRIEHGRQQRHHHAEHVARQGGPADVAGRELVERHRQQRHLDGGGADLVDDVLGRRSCRRSGSRSAGPASSGCRARPRRPAAATLWRPSGSGRCWPLLPAGGVECITQARPSWRRWCGGRGWSAYRR